MKKYLQKLPQDIRKLIGLCGGIAAQSHTRAYLVGGFVRDLLLGVAHKGIPASPIWPGGKNLDLDIVVEGDGIKFAECLAESLGSRIIRHHAFGTATIVSGDHLKIDVSTARKEAYPRPGQLPRVSPGSIEDDLFRRDFSINAMAIDISPAHFGKLIDTFAGLSDLKAKKVRVLHDMSFIDDPTRIIRAIRFEQRYAFNIEPKTLTLLKASAGANMLEAVGPHRLRNELVLLLKEREPLKGLVRLQALVGLDLIHKKLRLLPKTRALLAAVKKEIAWFNKKFPRRRRLDSWLMYFMSLVDGLNAAHIQDLCDRFAFAKGETKRMLDLKRLGAAFARKLSRGPLRPYQLFSLLEPLPYEVILLIKAKNRERRLQAGISEFLSIHHGTRICLRGQDLEKMGCPPGPHYQEIFKKILRARLDGRALSRQEELALACKMARKYNYRGN